MDYIGASLPVVLTTLFLGCTCGLRCLEDESCVGYLEVKRVNNVTYCCADPSATYMDLKQVAPGNITCHCTTEAAAAAAYADRTMSQGLRSCHWGSKCAKEEMSLNNDNDNDTFCCLGDKQYFNAKRFGPGNAVCRCRGSSLPQKDLHRYAPMQTQNASSSGEACSYDWGCADNPSTICQSNFATFCCFGSRGVETRNDRELNSTRCTCTNDYMGTRCEKDDPFPVKDANFTDDLKCRSGNVCKGVPPSYSCSHGNKLFCCPYSGLNLTITGGVISNCTCVSGGRNCSIAFIASVATVSVWSSSINSVIFVLGTGLLFWWW